MVRAVLTFAELAFLVEDSEVRRRIHLDDDRTDGSRAAGFASLVARGLLSVRDDVVEPIPELARLLHVVSRPVRWVDIALAQEDFATAVVLAESNGDQVAVLPRPFGAWELGDVAEARPLPEVAAHVVGEFYAEHATGAVFVSCGHRPARGLILDRRAADEVAVLDAGDDGAEPQTCTLAASIDAVRAFITP